jgi:hypothetical protein
MIYEHGHVYLPLYLTDIISALYYLSIIVHYETLKLER